MAAVLGVDFHTREETSFMLKFEFEEVKSCCTENGDAIMEGAWCEAGSGPGNAKQPGEKSLTWGPAGGTAEGIGLSGRCNFGWW